MRRYTTKFARFGRLSLNALAVLALSLTLGVTGSTNASAQITVDEVNYDWLHREWERFLPRESNCVWPTYYVDENAGRGGDGSRERPFATLAEALAASADPAVCGPTVILFPGRYEIGRLVVEKPTILRGHPGTTIVASILNVSALPLWLEEIILADAPFPGAVFATHPEGETTLVQVEIRRATGFGLLLHGGLLEMSDSRIEASRAGDTAQAARMIGELTSLLPRTGPYVPSHLDSLQEAVDALPDGVLTPSLSPDFTVKVQPDLVALIVKCSGTGLYVSGGAHVILSGATNYFVDNDRAGLVATDLATYVEGHDVYAQSNGVSGLEPAYNNEIYLLESGYCLGGIQVRQQAFVNLTGVNSSGNNYYGVIVHHGGMSFFNGLATFANTDLFDIGLGYGMIGFDGSLAAQNFGSHLNELSGILIQSTSQFYLSSGQSTQNRYGVISSVCDIENYLAQHNVTVSGNTEADILLLPSCPQPVPTPPPLP